MIDDDIILCPESFYSTKHIFASGSLVGKRKIKAIAVLEHGTEKCANLLRPMYTTPIGIQESLHICIYYPNKVLLLLVYYLSNSGRKEREEGL